VLSGAQGGTQARFVQEAIVLSELEHPSIVRYVGHGNTPHGAPFLVMEWLEGEDLTARLARSPLSASECLALLRRASAGLAEAHARGVVHRDVKPSNLFLVRGEPGLVKLVDFGVARIADSDNTLTRSGALLGTVGYMAPEQAMGPREVDARADVFALGCVAFECLTGRPAFTGKNAVAVLAKVLRDEAPRLRDVLPSVPDALDSLVAAMLSKEPERRPRDGARVLSLLGSHTATLSSASVAAPAFERGRVVNAVTHRIVSVVMGRPTRAHRTASAEEASASSGEELSLRLTERFGTAPVSMRGGGVLVVFSGHGVATDEAEQAAACALELSEGRPLLEIVVATGRAELTEQGVLGDVIDRAAELLTRDPGSLDGVVLDELTAGLLRATFEVRQVASRTILVGRRADEAGRHLLGRSTPFVGRERELGFLEMTMRQCAVERVARGVIITGPPGHGKSRLRREFVARIEAHAEAKVLMARADPVGSRSALALVRQLLRSAFGMADGDRNAEREKLRAYLELLMGSPAPPRLVDFLGHLVSAPPAPDRSPEMRVALGDPRALGAGLARSFGEWLDAECGIRPLLLVLEDVHWADRTSLAFLTNALASRTDLPLMMLALTRSGAMEAFQSARSSGDFQEVSLTHLSPRAAGRLVRSVAGPALNEDVIAGIVSRAAGNPFYLEELIRHAVEQGGDGLPGTVVALVQSRLERLDPRGWQLVRAASIFGDVFWRDGVGALVGRLEEQSALDEELKALTAREIITLNGDSRFGGQEEYTFRHSILREVAYESLADVERVAGHALAATWLSHEGERDALTLAEHFERGEKPEQAIHWFARAAENAVNYSDMRTAARIGQHALSLGATGEEKGALLWALGQAAALNGEWRSACEASAAAMELLPEHSDTRLAAAAGTLFAAGLIGDMARQMPALQAIASTRTSIPDGAAFCAALFWTVQATLAVGQVDLARSMLSTAVRDPRRAIDPASAAWLKAADGYLMLASGDLGPAYEALVEATALGKSAGATLATAASSMCVVFAIAQTGHIARTEAAAQEALALCEPLGMDGVAGWIHYHLALAEVVGGRAADSLAALRSLLGAPDLQLVAAARGLLVCAHYYLGELEEANRLSAPIEIPVSASHSAGEHGRNALLSLAAGNLDTALTLAHSGVEASGCPTLPLSRTWTALILAEVLHAAGRAAEARAQIRTARAALVKMAEGLADVELRKSFLHGVHFNARTLALAEEWLEGERA
jgi:hypothetical protein